MLLPHNPYRLSQHYKRHVCGPSYSCKHRFLRISPIFEHYFCLNYMGTVCHWQPCWTTTRVQFIGQCWYFNPQWNPEQAIKKASCVGKSITYWQNCAVAMCWHMNQGFWRGLGGGGDPFWLHREALNFKGSCSIPKHCSISDRSEHKNPPNFDTLCDPFMGRSASKG